MTSLHVQWRTDPIPYDGTKSTSSRYIYVITTDREGRHSNTPYIGRLYGEHPPSFPEEQLKYRTWMKEGKVGPRPEFSPLIPYLYVFELDARDKLVNWWNIKAWAEMDLPTYPETP